MTDFADARIRALAVATAQPGAPLSTEQLGILTVELARLRAIVEQEQRALAEWQEIRRAIRSAAKAVLHSEAECTRLRDTITAELGRLGPFARINGTAGLDALDALLSDAKLASAELIERWADLDGFIEDGGPDMVELRGMSGTAIIARMDAALRDALGVGQ